MSRQCCLQRQTSRHRGTALAALVAAVLLASPAAAMTRAATSPVGAANAAQLCALVIQINTKYGTMKNKRFLPVDSISANQWKATRRRRRRAAESRARRGAEQHQEGADPRTGVLRSHQGKSLRQGDTARPVDDRGGHPDHQLRADEMRHQVLAPTTRRGRAALRRHPSPTVLIHDGEPRAGQVAVPCELVQT